MCGDPLAPPRIPHAFSRGRLDVDPVLHNTHILGQIRTHPLNVRAHPRRLGDDRGVEIGDPQATRRDRIAHASQQHAAVDAPVLLVRIREMPPYVAQPGRTEDRVTDGMNQHITVRMRLQAPVAIDADATDRDMSAFTEAMCIEAMTDTHNGFTRVPEGSAIITPVAR